MKSHQLLLRNNSQTIQWLSLAVLLGACASDKDTASGGTDAAIVMPETDARHDAGAQHLSAREWIEEEFSEDPTKTGDFSSRQNIEMPVLVRDATNTDSKYAFQARDTEAPNDRRVGFINVEISNLESSDAFGSGISTRNEDPGTELFIAEVTIEPYWPDWVNYATTNYDGLTLDGKKKIRGRVATCILCFANLVG